jgi:hypothetical protein
MIVGDKVKITGGKYKNEWGYLRGLKESFCEVEINKYIKSKANGDSVDEVERNRVRAKRDFIEVIVDDCFEMPDEKDLQVVEELPKDPETLNEAVQMVIEDMKMPDPENDDDILSQHSEDEHEDITAFLPSIDEALDIKKENIVLKDDIKGLENVVEMFKKQQSEDTTRNELHAARESVKKYMEENTQLKRQLAQLNQRWSMIQQLVYES